MKLRCLTTVAMFGGRCVAWSFTTEAEYNIARDEAIHGYGGFPSATEMASINPQIRSDNLYPLTVQNTTHHAMMKHKPTISSANKWFLTKQLRLADWMTKGLEINQHRFLSGI